MKLALCLFKYFPYGGLQRNFLAIVKELISRGHHVCVYTGSWEGERDISLEIQILPVTGFTNHSRNRSFVRHLAQALKNKPVDLVVGFNKMPDLDVYYCADTCFATKAYEEKSFAYRLTGRSRWALQYETAVFGSDSQTEILLLSSAEGEAFKKYYGVSAQRLHLMPPGIARDRVRHADAGAKSARIRAELDIGEGERIIAFLGSDYKRKGLERLLRAYAALSPTDRENHRVIVIGQDKRASQYKSLTGQLGISNRVDFLGERDDVPDLLFASYCLVHPAYTENTGNVILEAIVAGAAVICTEVCGYAFYVGDNQLGKVIPEPFEQDTMNRQLQELLHEDVDWRARCAQFAANADVYSRPQSAAETIETIGRRL